MKSVYTKKGFITIVNDSQIPGYQKKKRFSKLLSGTISFAEVQPQTITTFNCLCENYFLK